MGENPKNHVGVCCAVRNFCKSSGLAPNIETHNGRRFREFGGELPAKLVTSLQAGGASVEVYRHKGVVSTVVSI